MLDTKSGAIKASNLTLSYSKHEPIVSNVDFEIKEGEFVFISGVSGSGKSTLIKSFYGVLEPFFGTLEVNGISMKNVKKDDIYDLRKDLGIVFQDYKLIQDMTVGDNVALPLIIQGKSSSEAMEHAKKLLTYVNLIHRMHRYPNEISGGEQQRASLSRALSTNPKMILADEPTGNLDEYSAGIVYDLMVAANQRGRTVVVVTHHIPDDFPVPYRKFHIKDASMKEIDV